MTETQSSPIERIRYYILTGWDRLTRNLFQCQSYDDPKTLERLALWFPMEFNEPKELAQLQKSCPVELNRLPERIRYHGQLDGSKLSPHGLLYLPHPYVVPGGHFNEMYGWDSYFIILGLIRDDRIVMAKGMLDNFFFEIEHYAAILNANRSYYLARSQPPFLTSSILAVYKAEAAMGIEDRDFLACGYDYAIRDYDEWNRGEHRAGDTGLSRYYAHGDGPVPEILGDPHNYYFGVANYFLMHGDPTGMYFRRWPANNPPPDLMGPVFPVSQCGDAGEEHTHTPECESKSDKMSLTRDYYEGDRTMRESGFDVTFRFDPYSAGTHHFAPVCLNALLYRTEKDLETIARILGRNDEAATWAQKAETRKHLMDRFLWDESRGQYFDFDLRTGKTNQYEFLTTFFPLWAGAASQEQAGAVVKNLKNFEEPGGLATSRNESQAQWDFPYGWAPLQLLAVEGMRRYGFKAEADRVAFEFCAMVLENYLKDGTIREKYDVVRRTAETKIRKGYRDNFVGFGWTNGVFLELLAQLPADRLRQLNEVKSPLDAAAASRAGVPVSVPSAPQPQPAAAPSAGAQAPSPAAPPAQ